MRSDTFDLLEQAGWPAFVVEAGGTIRRANHAAVELFGAPLESGASSLSALWPAGSETAEQFLSRWERSATPKQTVKLNAKGGQVRDCVIGISSCQRDGEKRFLFQVFPTLLEGAVDSAAIQRQRLDCAHQLARTVALDFNNALTAILGHVSLLLTKTELAHPFRASLVEVERAAERAAEISNQLAAFSRQEKEAATLAPGNFNELVRRAIAVFQQSKAQNINFNLHLDKELLGARFDEAKALQALVKVIENAREAVGDYGNIRITTSNIHLTQPRHEGSITLAPGGYVCTEVFDDGPGIEPDVLPRVFEPFFTTKPGHRGLGLAFVYGVITNHGGSVVLSSVFKKGTSVRIYLPATHAKSLGSSTKAALWGRGETILFVDDEELLLNLARTVLSSSGYKVLTANNAQRALEILQAGSPRVSLLVTDLVMPQMTGRQLVDRARNVQPEVKVIITSGYHRAAEGPAAVHFLQKPFSSQDLLKEVKQVLDAAPAT